MIIDSGRSGCRTRLVAFAAAALTDAAAITFVVNAQTVTLAAVGVEDDGADCPVSLPGSTPANANPPDPFTRIDGTRITSTADWRCRRAEIKRLTERYVGEKRRGGPEAGQRVW
ncbi:hypothetical protein ACQEVC_23975 [Plantactinospora sp. CA-294935]|uniref:hypothetical protein n=1 Tax=Plantactinospora sp. CA-294935 TaxID=3240012 RepID=UPI003D900458